MPDQTHPVRQQLPHERQSELKRLFDGLIDREYPDPNEEFDLVISSAGDYGASACSAFAGALWLMDHATAFLTALKQQAGEPVAPGDLLDASAAIAQALAAEIDLPPNDETLQVAARIFADLGVVISSDVASSDWENRQKEKLQLLTEQASHAFSGTGNERAILPWALGVERTPAVPPLEDRVRSLREVLTTLHSPEPRELNMWAYFLLLIGRWKAATAMALVATEMDAGFSNLDTLGWAYFFEGENDKALELISAAMRMLEPTVGTTRDARISPSDWAEVGYHKCYVLLHSGHHAEAAEVFQRLLATAPDSFWTHKAQKLEGLLHQNGPAFGRGVRLRAGFVYDVALSFAGEDRACAAQIAERLRARGISVFYDEFLKAELWGKNLYSYLSGLYQEKARFCVMLLSRAYASKPWPTLEREAAQARAFISAGEYILPVRIDGSPVPGILSTIGYLDWEAEGPDGIVENICKKLLA